MWAVLRVRTCLWTLGTGNKPHVPRSDLAYPYKANARSAFFELISRGLKAS